MTVRTKLVGTLVLVILIVMAPSFYGVLKLTELRDIVLYRQSELATAYLSLARVQNALADLDRSQRGYLVAPGPQQRLEVRQALSNARFDLSQLSDIGYGEAAEQVQTRLDTLEVASARIERLIADDDPAAATAYFDSLRTVYVRTESLLERIGDAIDGKGRLDARRAVEVSVSAAQRTVIAVWISLAIALALGLATIGNLMSPLGALREAMANVAGGSFIAPENLPYKRSDEVGDLSRSFRLMTERLDELDRLKAEFVSIASHELKTPIHIINGYAEMIEEGTLGDVTEKQHDALRRIGEQAGQMTDRVNQLLNLTRFLAGGLKLEVERVRTQDLFTDLRLAFEILAEQQGIDFEIEVEGSAPAILEVDRTRVTNELFGNLLSNAFKFTPAGGSVVVKAAGGDETLVVRVIDTGRGIPPEQLPYIFEKYYQAGSEGRAVGAGLGLAIARQIVDAHGGQISATSEPDRGTTVEVILPIRSGSSPSDAAVSV
ncbi:MAG: HAMP domain-containing histidine kinase [Gemmatimonadota bacterium]|jgi:signal transduction histidine kinase|nr:MAG: HAMP domain-containing histidine kinase [Gemmatimonadota bacterium]